AQFTKTTVPQGGSLSVYSRDSDSTPPEVRRVWLDKATVSAGQRNLVIVDIQDDRSGVGSVNGRFQSPTGTAFSDFSCHANADSGFWEGDLSVPANADCGYWTLNQLRVVDLANNVAYLPRRVKI